MSPGDDSDDADDAGDAGDAGDANPGRGERAALTRDDFRAVESLFDAASRVPPEERIAFVLSRTGDARVRREVLALLTSSDHDDNFLEPPTTSMAAPSVDGDGAEGDPLVGQRIAGYTIVRRIASGGMGVVYEASQESPRRTVAVKLIRPDLVSAETLHRFKQEAEILGRLQHPGIAAVLEAGAFVAEGERGARPRPFCAMEFVDGIAIDEWVFRHSLSTEERAALLAQVCDAVDHAHRRGVIHRDLKTGNILVTPAGQPKVLDFGIARAVDGERSVTLRTSVGHIVGTLGSMSPEQLRGDPAAIDARTDVYALGVLAYELLAGRSPFDLRQRGVPESIQHLLDVEPTSLGTIRRELRGDLSTVVAKAMAKEQDRRYPTAAAMASDLRAWREHRPVAARPPSRSYLASKFVRRHRGAVAGVVAAFVLLLLAATVAAFGWRRAEAAADRTRAVNGYLTGLLAWFDPDKVGGSDMPIEKALDAAGQRIGPLLANEPDIAIDVHRVLGERYAALGLWPQAEGQFRKIVGLSRERHGEESLEVANALCSVARMLKEQGSMGEAQRLYERALAVQERTLPPGDLRIGETLNDLAVTCYGMNGYADAERLQRRAIEIARMHPELEPRILATAINNFAATLFLNGKQDEAVDAIEEAIAIRRSMGEPDLDHAVVLVGGAQILAHSPGHVERAEQMLREAYEIRRERLAPSDPRLADSRIALAKMTGILGRHAEAVALLQEWLEHPPKQTQRPGTLSVPFVLRMLAAEQRAAGDEPAAAATEARSAALVTDGP